METRVVPPEVDRWNWGAFLMSWIWSLFNQVWIGLLALVPFVGFVMMFVLGARGSRWAWQAKRWDSVEQFRRVQRAWAIAGVVVWAFFIAMGVAIYFAVTAMLKESDAYKLGLQQLQANAQAMAALGPPITTGFPSGSIQTSGPSGEAQLAIPVAGQKARGTLYVEATRSMGVWKANRMELEVEGRAERIDIIGGGTPI